MPSSTNYTEIFTSVEATWLVFVLHCVQESDYNCMRTWKCAFHAALGVSNWAIAQRMLDYEADDERALGMNPCMYVALGTHLPQQQSARVLLHQGQGPNKHHCQSTSLLHPKWLPRQ